ncbi:MAG: PVC-type heme-binding CxxCH protein [Verrucomicrobiota bacterium]
MRLPSLFLLPLFCLSGSLRAQNVFDGKTPLNPNLAPEGAAGWQAAVPLFDGKSMAGWEGETKSVWRVVDGVITGGTMAGNPQNEFLSTTREYRDFILTLEYRLTGTEGFVNGGVQFRSQRVTKPANEMTGYQADIGAGYSGCLYDESRRNRMLAVADREVIAKAEKPGEWNRYEIRCGGPRIRISVNGVLTVDYTEAETGMALKGKIGLQIHGGNKAVVEYRNLKIQERAAASDTPRPLSEAETMRRFGDWKPRAARGPFPDGKFTLEADETVVFLGGGREARQGERGFLEARLARAFSKEAPRFRWMAVPGDTVYEQAREMNFGSWTGQLQWSGATVVVCRFGRMESLDGEERLPEFKAAYHRLLDLITPVTRRIVLVQPMWPDSPPGASPEETARRMDLAQKYAAAVREIAQAAGVLYSDPAGAPVMAAPPGLRQADAPFVMDTGFGLYLDAASVAAGLGLSIAESPSEELLADIAEKNRLWTDCWRPDNWAFAFGDRMNTLFDKPGRDGAPFLKDEYEMLKPRVAELDARIAARVSYQPLPPVSPPPPVPASAPALTPAEEQAGFTMAEGFEVNLFASEELGVVKPVQFSWDEKGRLYVACSPMYPHLEPGSKPADYILVCEDTDGDGKADRSWKFADGFTMVQGVEPGDGGVYVCDFDRLTFLQDTDGDGKADLRKVIYTGFGTGDTHQLINSISHGDDGALWFSQGLHNLARVETPYGIRRLERAGVWRLDPRTLRLERYFNKHTAGMNCWGVAFDDFGQVFHKSGDRPTGYWSVPGLIPAENPDDYDAIGGLFQTNPKTTALEFLGTAAMPDDLQGCALTAGFMGSVIEAFTLSDDGAGYKTGPARRLLTSKSDAFRPVDVSVGPDGAIYACDFYNPVIGHYQASYRDPLRDHTHGRIWRLTAKGRASVKPPALAGMTAGQLLNQLGFKERWTRAQARRLLGDAPEAAVMPALKEWFAASSGKPEAEVREALCVAQAHHWPADAGAAPALERLSRSADFRMRAYTARVAGETPGGGAVLERLITDEHPRVRLCAVVSLAQKPSAAAALAVARVLELPSDRFLDYALTQAFRYILETVPPEAISFTKPGHRDFALKAAGGGLVVKPAGQVIYETICLNCHQPTGQGLPGIYPPISANPRVNGDPSALAKILMHGLTGPIDGFTQTVAVPMPPTGLTDQQISDVLTWLRGNLGNHSGPVTPEQIRTVREASAARDRMWTPGEL